MAERGRAIATIPSYYKDLLDNTVLTDIRGDTRYSTSTNIGNCLPGQTSCICLSRRGGLPQSNQVAPLGAIQRAGLWYAGRSGGPSYVWDAAVPACVLLSASNGLVKFLAPRGKRSLERGKARYPPSREKHLVSFER